MLSSLHKNAQDLLDMQYLWYNESQVEVLHVVGKQGLQRHHVEHLNSNDNSISGKKIEMVSTVFYHEAIFTLWIYLKL